METTNFENIAYNYFVNNTSYVKSILDSLSSEVSSKKKALIMEIFNLIFSSLNDEEKSDIIRMSEAFNEQMTLSSNKNIMLQSEYLYKNFLEKMLFDSYNRMRYFDIMNECIKVSVGYYEEYQNDDFYQMNDNSINNIHIK